MVQKNEKEKDGLQDKSSLSLEAAGFNCGVCHLNRTEKMSAETKVMGHVATRLKHQSALADPRRKNREKTQEIEDF